MVRSHAGPWRSGGREWRRGGTPPTTTRDRGRPHDVRVTVTAGFRAIGNRDPGVRARAKHRRRAPGTGARGRPDGATRVLLRPARPDGAPCRRATPSYISVPPAGACARADVAGRRGRRVQSQPGSNGSYPFDTMGGVVAAASSVLAVGTRRGRPMAPVVARPGPIYVVVHENAHQWFGDRRRWRTGVTRVSEGFVLGQWRWSGAARQPTGNWRLFRAAWDDHAH